MYSYSLNSLIISVLPFRTCGLPCRYRASLPRAQPLVYSRRQQRAEDRGNDEEPELSERPAALEHGHADAAGRVHAGIGDRDADEVDEHQDEADGDAAEPGREFRMGGAEHCEYEEEGEDDFHFDETDDEDDWDDEDAYDEDEDEDDEEEEEY